MNTHPFVPGVRGGGLPEEGLLDRSVEQLGFSTRVRNCLRRARVRSVRELAGKSRDELLRLPGFGTRCLAEVEERLRALGLSLYSPPAQPDAPGGARTRGARERQQSPTRIDAPTLEAAAEELLSSGGVSRTQRDALLARLGWFSARACSLQEAGDMLGVTRERVRQIQVRLERWAPRGIVIPVLQRALEVVRMMVPATVPEVERRLVEEGLTQREVHPAGLIRLARFQGLDAGFEVVGVTAVGEVVVSPGAAPRVTLVRTLRQELRKRTKPFGFAHTDLVEDILTRIAPDLASREFVPLLMSAIGAMPVAEDWFYLKTDPRAPALRLLLDMVAVAGGVLSADEARVGFERRLRWRASAGHVSWTGSSPSAEALAGFAASMPELFRVSGGRITSVQPLDWRERLDGAERVMVEVLYEAPGRVLTRDAFERQVVDRGVNPNTFGVYTSYSPFVKELGGGLWTVRGIVPDALEVERLRRRRRRRQRRVEGWRWLPSGALRVEVRLGRIGGLVVGLPSATRAYLRDRVFEVYLPDGVRRGKVRVNGEGSSWGYGPALRQLGAREGDVMLADFDLAAGTVALSLALHGDATAGSGDG